MCNPSDTQLLCTKSAVDYSPISSNHPSLVGDPLLLTVFSLLGVSTICVRSLLSICVPSCSDICVLYR